MTVTVWQHTIEMVATILKWSPYFYLYYNINYKKVNTESVINIHTSEMIISAVKKDLGIGYVIYNQVENEIKNNEIQVLNIKEDLPTVEINIIYDDYFLTTAPKRFIEEYIKYNIE